MGIDGKKLNDMINALRSEASELAASIRTIVGSLKLLVRHAAVPAGKRKIISECIESMDRYLDPQDLDSLGSQVDCLIWYYHFWTSAAKNHPNHSKMSKEIEAEIKALAETRSNQINNPIRQAREHLSQLEELWRTVEQEETIL